MIYTCDACGVRDREVRVQARLEGEDILVWMRVLQTRVSIDHARVSPRCEATELTNAKIPLESDRGIGMARTGDSPCP